MTPCPKCQSTVGNVNVVHVEISLFSVLRQPKIQVGLTCKACNKKILSKYWDENIISLVKAKREQYKLSFFQRHGIPLGIVVVLFVLFSGTFIYLNVLPSFNASKNFTEAYGVEASRKWYENLTDGDFLLCNKNYKDAAQVFQIVSISEDEVEVKAFDQYFPYESYSKLAQFKELPLGDAPYVSMKIQKEVLMKHGYVKDISEGGLSLKYLNIVQIRKAK